MRRRRVAEPARMTAPARPARAWGSSRAEPAAPRFSRSLATVPREADAVGEARAVTRRPGSSLSTPAGPVRIHTDARATRSASSLGAAAYTLGDSIVFGEGRYAPGTARGDALLAHEAAHVAQQRGAASTDSPAIDPQPAQERAARQAPAAAGPGLATQAIQRAPEDVDLGDDGAVDTVMTGVMGSAWPFLKSMFRGFMRGLRADQAAGRYDEARDHLSQLWRPWNAARFYGGYVVGLVLGFISPITDLVKGAIGLVKLAGSAIEWMVKWSPAGIAVSPERQAKIGRVKDSLVELNTEFNSLLLDFIKDPKGTMGRASDYLNDMMRLALDKAGDIGAKGAHAIAEYLTSSYYEVGKGVGTVIGTAIAQILMLVFSDAIGNFITKGASLIGKVAEAVAGKAVELFNMMKGFIGEGIATLRAAAKGALKFASGLIEKLIKVWESISALFSEAAAAAVESHLATAGAEGGSGLAKPGAALESRIVKTGTRTSPATVADLKPPKVHPSNAGKPATTPKPASPVGEPVKPVEAPKAEVPKPPQTVEPALKEPPVSDPGVAEPAAPKPGGAEPPAQLSKERLDQAPLKDKSLSRTERRGKEILEEFAEHQRNERPTVKRELLAERGVENRSKAASGVKAPPRHHILSQEHIDFLAERGIPESEVHKWTIELEQAQHEAIHTGRGVVRGDGKAFEWNTRLMEEMVEWEAEHGRQLGPKDVARIARKLMRDYRLPRRKLVPYRSPR